MSDVPLILLPPSEGKASGGTGASWGEGTMRIDLDKQRVRVAKALRSSMRAKEAERSKLLGVKGEALASATAANRGVLEAPSMAALERYTGVLYEAVGFDTLDERARTTADESVLILSGLWGLVAPPDPIPDYKIKMGARLGALGRLSAWWKEPLNEALMPIVDGRRVWNLLPKEHDAAVDSTAVSKVASEQISAVFLEPNKAGELVAVSHWNKFLKGALVRHLLERPAANPEDLLEWEHPSGFRLDPNRTTIDGTRTILSFVRSD